MLAFLTRRILGGLVILLIICAVTFMLFYIAPGSNVARLACGKTCSPELVAAVAHQMGVDKPVWQQFLVYLGGIFAGRTIGDNYCGAPCLGYSFHNHRPVLDTIVDRLPVTLSLTIGAVVIFLAVGVGSGMLAALRKGKLSDKAAMGFAVVGGAQQIFVLGPFLLFLFVYSTHIMDVPHYTSFLSNPLRWAIGLLLPWVCLAIITAAYYARLTRSSMVEVLSEDYIRTVRAKGMGQATIYVKHAFRGAMSPIATLLGLDIAVLLGGAIITETVFNLPGVGQLAATSVKDSDLPVMMAVVLLAAAAVVVANIVVDVVYAFIDPRVRLR
ncbi:ABC transporter permease [Nocardia terpenica]|uniref:ABC transporter permease n=1 Tax=Nocardia terpenica TaxID=455432 RepID=A0A164M223_9NOCA|nr:ABC transporter permease [Nocardia terpenica]KZM72955.1 ABC transporter permease [Nocardia terpenica]MBF6061116.1 ABC transporter permease [Nocardia terpenica]MBF6105655.1 ABC transporter permease [Nocardia terpenica]MBF6112875.1 ABC transporter permease [Nocardia terpenica]MBF6119005.1 ABC transporter permease [Nocardia terpenica]